MNDKACCVTGVAVACDLNIINKAGERRLKYRSLAIEISRIRNLRTTIFSLVMGPLGLVPHNRQRNLAIIPGTVRDWEI